MMLIDTSILISLFRDKSGKRRDAFRRFLGGGDYVLSRFTQLELLQGTTSEPQWLKLSDYLEGQDYAEISPSGWHEAAHIHFDLRRRGLTVRSIIDCCIAQLAIERRLTLVHNDRDFESIAQARPLKQRRLEL